MVPKPNGSEVSVLFVIIVVGMNSKFVGNIVCKIEFDIKLTNLNKIISACNAFMNAFEPKLTIFLKLLSRFGLIINFY